jgi:hypothetical protein
MRNKRLNGNSVFVVIGILIVGGVVPSSVIATNATHVLNNSSNVSVGTGQSEYWALLVAVGVYADNPMEDRPLMLDEVQDLKDTLLQSDIWSEDHIKMITGKDATIRNIYEGFKWLDSMETSEDISVVFISTHGFPLGSDIPPLDEEDGTDEALVSYWGFAYPNLFIWDDELNFWLNRLESQGVCLIVDSCYAGGFNDPPGWNILDTTNKMSAQQWAEGFGEDVQGQNRVVLMASQEDEVSYSGGFAPYLIDGLRGYADSNTDGIVTAEEVYYYAEPRPYRQHPTMYDGYDGELPLMYNTVESKTASSALQQADNIKQHNAPIAATQAPENSILCGYVTDNDTGDPIENVAVNIHGRDADGQSFNNDTTTDISGYYTFNVPAGRGRLSIIADGYYNIGTSFIEITENDTIWVNFSLLPLPPETSIICGYITDLDTEDPIDEANVHLTWHDGGDHYYQNNTLSDPTGFYCMNVAAGDIDLEASAEGFFRESISNIAIASEETIWGNISLTSLPEENAVICGYLTDKDTGDPINDASITFEWIDITEGYSYQKDTHTDEFGFYSIALAPGELYHDIRKQGYDYYNPYRQDAIADETTWTNETLAHTLFEVEIAKPLQALYLNNERVIPTKTARIFGSIDVEVYIAGSWDQQGQAEKVEFYVDDALQATVDTTPFLWTWSDVAFGKHTLKILAYNDEGATASDELQVIKFM